MKIGFRSTMLVAVAIGLVTTGCTWGAQRFDRTNRGTNPFESTISTANVATLTPSLRTEDAITFGFPPALLVRGDRFYVSRLGGTEMFAADPSPSCSGSPLTCVPLATAVGAPDPTQIIGDMLFGNDKAFPAALEGCAGSPPACAPSWTENPFAGPIPSDGTLRFDQMHFQRFYLYTGTHIEPEYLLGYDAAGQKNCTGSPKHCDPVFAILVTPVGHQWSAGTAVTHNRVYVRDLYASVQGYDASGAVVWQTNGIYSSEYDQSIIIDGDRVIVTAHLGNEEQPRVMVFDATGIRGCSGNQPVRCSPIWMSDQLDEFNTQPAVSGNRVFVGSGTRLLGFDLAAACADPTSACSPVWQADFGTAMPAAPTIANGLVFAGSEDGARAFDAAGSVGCSGVPALCTPLWSAQSGETVASPVIANGHAFVSGADGTVTVYRLAG